MHIERLVIMVNDIAEFFHGAASADEAASSIAAHLRNFWDPRMRKQIIEHARGNADGLSELAKRGVLLLADTAPTNVPVRS